MEASQLDQKFTSLEQFLTKIEVVAKDLDRDLRLIEIQDAEKGSERDSPSNQVEEMLSTSDLYLIKIRSFVSSGRDILKDIQKNMKETNSSLEQYKNSLNDALVKLKEGKENLKVLSQELVLKNEDIRNLHSEIDYLKEEIGKWKGDLDDERKKRAKTDEKNHKIGIEINEIKEKLQELSIAFESQKQKINEQEAKNKDREVNDNWGKDAMILADFVFNLESSLKSKMKIKNNVKFTLKSIFYNKEEERKTFERTLKDLNISEYFVFEEEVVNIINEIKNERLAFAHFDKSFFSLEDVFAIAEKNYGNQTKKMKAFDILLKLEKLVGK